MIKRVLAAAGASAAVGWAGYRAGALTGKGALAAAVVGSAVIGGAGSRGAVLLGTFFASGSILTRVTPRTQTAAGSGERNERQVLANGGVAALAAGFSGMIGQERAFAMLAGSIAAATSDTWATEFGSTSMGKPRLILSRIEVPAGVSGGVTARGNLGALVGAASIGLLVALSTRNQSAFATTTLAGVTGAVVDSMLGEVVQVRRWDRVAGSVTEATSVEGVPTGYHSGWKWVDNDIVNLACTASGALVALALHELAGATFGERTADAGQPAR